MEAIMASENRILDRLKEKGIITEEQIKEIAMDGVDDTMNASAELMHILLCNQDHAYAPEDAHKMGVCCWYAEQTFDNCWHMVTHKAWLIRSTNEMTLQRLQSPKELHDFLLVAIKAAAEIHFLKSKWPNSGELLKELL